MSKLARKFLLSLSAILFLVIMGSIYLNSHIIERYYLFLERRDLQHVCDQLIAADAFGGSITQLEQENDVTIVQVEYTENNELLNTRLRNAFRDKGLGFEKFWLWQQDQWTVEEAGRKRRLYEQEKLHYSLLVEYFILDTRFFAAVKLIPAMGRTITLINIVTACVFTAALLILLIFLFLLIRKITEPLAAIGKAARAIANLDFCRVEVKSGDELENLAGDINHMSQSLQDAHKELETKNLQMKTLLANVSHDLKTPVSLIKAYANGMKDGVDDGTFLDTILIQNGKMEQMIERLLDLAKMENPVCSTEPVDLTALLRDTVSDHQLQARNRGLSFQFSFPWETAPAIIIMANLEAVQLIFSNLVSNAVKYAAGNQITLTLLEDNGACMFQIENEVDSQTAIDPQRLWEPFYVVEASRNKNKSGTGLGLSIVRAAAQKYGYACSCELTDGKIRFIIRF